MVRLGQLIATLTLCCPILVHALPLYVHEKDHLGLEVVRGLSPQLAEQAGLPEFQIRIIDTLAELRQRLDNEPNAVVVSGISLSSDHTQPWFQRTLGLVHRRDFAVDQPLNQRLALVPDQSESAAVMRQFPQVTWQPYSTVQMALKDLAAGTTDGVVGPLAELTNEVIRWQLSGMQFAPWVVSTPVVLHHRLNADLAMRLERSVAMTAAQADQIVGRSLLYVPGDQPRAAIGLPWASLAAVLAAIGVGVISFKLARRQPVPSPKQPLNNQRAPAPQAPVADRSQEYLNEVNQRLQVEIQARQAKEIELMAVQKELGAAQARLQQQVRTDPMTRIANRRYFDEVLVKEWRRHAREKTEFSLVLMDIDHFKQYNDTLGHPAGDECLRQVSAVLSQCFARSEDLVARYGGEEFVVLLPNTSSDDAIQQVQRLQSELSKLNLPHPSSPTASHITISMGVASCIPIFDDDPRGLVEEADVALYDAKTNGRNGYRVAAA